MEAIIGILSSYSFAFSNKSLLVVQFSGNFVTLCACVCRSYVIGAGVHLFLCVHAQDVSVWIFCFFVHVFIVRAEME